MKSLRLMAGAAILSAGLTSVISISAQAAPSNAHSKYGGIVDCWKFDEGVGRIASDCVGTDDATVGSGTAWVPGIIGGALHFDGTQNAYATIPSGVVSRLTNFTITAWVKVDVNATWNRVFDFGSGTNTYMMLTPDSSSNSVRYSITTNGNGAEQRIENTSPLSPGIWHLVAVVQYENIGKLYVDGLKVGENDNMTLRPQDLDITTANYIGKSQWAPDPYLLGSIDDFRIYDRPLAASEISSLAHLGGY